MKVRRRSSLPPSWALTTAPNCSPHLPQSVRQEAGSHHPAMTPSGTPVTHLTLHWDVFCVCLKARMNIMHCHFHFVPSQTPIFLFHIFLPASMVTPDKGRRTALTPSGPSSGTALLGPSLLDCNSHDSFQSRGLPDVAEVSGNLIWKVFHIIAFKWLQFLKIRLITKFLWIHFTWSKLNIHF